MDTLQQPVTGFDSTGLSPEILTALSKAGFVTPTPIQGKAIPIAMTGTDLIGIAQTGTGKTLAFSLPLLDKLLKAKGKGLIIVPTRELALQVEESIRKVSRLLNTQMRTVCLIGGMPIYRQIKDLKLSPRIVIATPGRLQDHLTQKTISLSDVTTLILDEADRMLDMGFEPQIKRILAEIPSDRQTMLFSATMAPEIAKLAAVYLRNPQRVEAVKEGGTSIQITQELCYVSQSAKSELLQTLLEKHEGSVLVFSRTKHGAANLSRRLQDAGHTAVEIHSNRSLGQRRHALDGFKAGKYRVLVATDVAARGIDVQDITLVINYDLPDAAEDYVHRIGRTGRAGKNGLAISFATHDQQRDVKNIERLIQKPLTLSAHSEDRPAVSWQPRQPMPRSRTSSFKPSSTYTPTKKAWGQRPGGQFVGSGRRSNV